MVAADVSVDVEGDLQIGEETADGSEAGNMFGDSVVAMAGKVFAVRSVEAGFVEEIVADHTAGLLREGIGRVTEAIGKGGRERDGDHNIVTRGDGSKEKTGAFLGAGYETSSVRRGEAAEKVSEALLVLKACQLSLRRKRITRKGNGGLRRRGRVRA